MPKIIENVKEKILQEAKEQVMTVGYSDMTMREVAKAVGIASGTLYNYFPSKESMVAAFMSEDWHRTVFNIRTECENAESVAIVLESIYNNLTSFVKTYEALFKDPEAVSGYSSSYFVRHRMLTKQIAGMIDPLCRTQAVTYTDNFSEFIAESLITWMMSQKDFAEYKLIIKNLFNHWEG